MSVKKRNNKTTKPKPKRKLGMNGVEEQLMRKKLKDKYGI